MGIKLSTNFDIGAPVPVDSKLVINTKAELTTINENIWPEGYLTICLEDKQLYIFNKNNTVDAETGKFRKVAADVDTSLFEKKAQGFMTLEQYNALKDAGNIIEDVDYYIEDTTEDGEANKAINVSYDNANTTLSAVNVQEALTELDAKKQDIVHYTVMPDPNTLEVDAIIQYIGITNEQYKEGRFYKVVEVDGTKSYTVVDTCANEYELKSEPMTQLEYDALEQLGEVDPNKSYYIEDGLVKDIPTDASTIAYNNAVSGLNTSNVQGAIDLLQSEKQPKGHYALKSQIPDTSNFVTKAVSNLINYYSKQQTYTKEEVQALLTNFSTLKMKIVDTLPSSGIETNVIYLIKDTGIDSYTQYAYINDVWATLGTTTVDLSNYYTKDESDNNFITESELNTALVDYVKSADLSVIAEQVSFDNADNGFTANNVQDALEELKTSKQDALNADQLSVLDSGITADKVAQIQDNTDGLATTLQFKTTDVADADELYTENGLYIVNTSTVANLPTAENSMGYCLEVIRYEAADASLIVQIAYRGRPTDEHPLYMRRKFAGAWTNWVGIASINDEAVNAYTTLSSEKINAIAAQLQANIDAKASIDDSATVLTSTWSSNKISKELGSKTYTTLAQLGLDASANLNDVITAMPKGSSFLVEAISFTDYQTIFPYEEENDRSSRVYVTKGEYTSNTHAVWFRKDGTKYAIANNASASNEIVSWNAVLTQKSDPYACATYKVLNGTEDLFTLAPGHYASANVNTAYNYPVTDADVTAHIYVIGTLNDPANNKGYRIILYFDNKNRMYRINERWGNFAVNGWVDMSPEIVYTDLTGDLEGKTTVLDLVNALLTKYRALSPKKPVRFVSGEITKTTLTDLPRSNGLLQITVSGYDVVDVSFAGAALGFKTMHYGFMNRIRGEDLFSSLFWELVDTPITELTDLGLDGSATIQDIMDAMTIGQHCIINTSRFDDKTEVDNIEYGKVEIRRLSSGMWSLWLEDVLHGNVVAHGTCSASKFAGWHYFATHGTDVALTTLTPSDGITAPTGLTIADGSKIDYCVKNGVCYVHIALKTTSITAKVNSWTTIAVLPKSMLERVGAMNCEYNSVSACMPIKVHTNGTLAIMYRGDTSSTLDWWGYSFSYPVV
jgi:hypothetical protein